ncbi:hypothetical protein HY971_04295 [Candidatus Kaiserbacteria bacterium]|nr:hypothetical protein [Candidatus Kaiserbacteria bacterium]
MPWPSQALKFTAKATIHSGKKVFKRGDPLWSKFFVTCSALMPREEEPRTLYLHSDGFWHEHATPNGYFSSREEADTVLADAK